MKPRSTSSTALLVILACLALGTAQAAAFPERPITILVGSSPGSTTDGLARAMASDIQKQTGQSVIVDNRAGAFGNIAGLAAARATPDGYTVFITTNTTQAANPHLLKKIPYDPIKDLQPVGQMVQGYMVMVVNPTVKAQTVAEFIALAKQAPGKLSFGSGSSSSRVATELFEHMTGTQLNYVPYKANPPAVMELVGGQTDMMIVDLTTSLAQVKSGKLRALGVSSSARSPLLPQVPTIAEAGLPGYVANHWNALYAPAHTPPAVVSRLNELMRHAMAQPGMKQFVEQNGMEVTPTSPEELSKFQLAELDRWGRIIKDAGIEPE